MLYVASDGDVYTLESRRRMFGASATTSVPVAIKTTDLPLEVGPNPLRAGSPVRFSGAASSADRLDIFDLAGRRVASTPIRAANGRFEAVLDASSTRAWRDGVYFAALRGSREKVRFVVLR